AALWTHGNHCSACVCMFDREPRTNGSEATPVPPPAHRAEERGKGRSQEAAGGPAFRGRVSRRSACHLLRRERPLGTRPSRNRRTWPSNADRSVHYPRKGALASLEHL